MKTHKEQNKKITIQPHPDHLDQPVIVKFLTDNAGSFSDIFLLIISILLTATVTLLNANKKKLNHLVSEILKPAPKIDVSTKSLIQGTIGTILGQTKADRVLILEYHNGNKLSSGYCFNKLTATYEIAVPNCTSIAHRFQAVPVSLIYPSLKDLENVPYLHINRDTVKERSYFNEVFDTSTESYFVISLNYVTKENIKKPLGFLIINFIERLGKEPPTLITSIIQNYANQLEFLLKSNDS